MEAQLGGRLSKRRFNAFLLGLFSGLALLLAALGIYGVVAHAVAQGRREIGIRMALGAQATQVLQMILSQGAWLVGSGLLLRPGALALRRALASVLFRVAPNDPGIFAVLRGASPGGLHRLFLPAHRATRVDPLVALRRIRGRPSKPRPERAKFE